MMLFRRRGVASQIITIDPDPDERFDFDKRMGAVSSHRADKDLNDINFPIRRDGLERWEIFFFRFAQPINTPNAIANMKRMPFMKKEEEILSPIGIEEYFAICALIKRYRKFQKYLPIAALGCCSQLTIWQSSMGFPGFPGYAVPCFYRCAGSGELEMGLQRFLNKDTYLWGNDWCFPAKKRLGSIVPVQKPILMIKDIVPPQAS